MINLKIAGEYLDLDSEVAYTISRSDVFNFNYASGNQTLEFDIPMSVKNSRLLGYADEFNVDLTTIRNRINSEIYLGVTLIDIGFIQINNLNKNVANITFYSGSSNWIDLINNRKLSELDFTAYNHLFTEANIVSRQNVTTGGVYPLMARGDITASASTTIPVTIDNFYPCLFASDIMRLIANEAGYVLKGNLLTDPFYKQLCLYNGADLSLSDDYVFERSGESNQVNGVISVGALSQNVVVNFTPSTLASQFFGNNSLFNDSTNRWVADGSYVLLFQGGFSWSASFRTCTFKLYKNGASIATLGSSQPYVNFYVTSSCVAGDYFELVAEIGAGANPVSLIGQGRVFVGPIKDFVLGSFVDYKALMPDLSQSDFFKSILAFCNGFAVTDTLAKTITIDRYEYLYGDEDWSEYLDLSQPQNVQYNKLIEDVYQNSYLTFEENEGKDLLTNGYPYGSGAINLPYDIIELEGEVLNVPFVGQKQVPILTATTNYILGMQAFEDPVIFLCKPYSVVDLSTSLSSLTYGSTAVSTVAYAWFYKPSITPNLDAEVNQMAFSHPSIPFFGQSILEQFYQPTKNILTRGVYVEAYLNLSDELIINFDFKKLKYIDFFRSWVLVNKIVEYKGGGVTLCELIILQ